MLVLARPWGEGEREKEGIAGPPVGLSKAGLQSWPIFWFLFFFFFFDFFFFDAYLSFEMTEPNSLMPPIDSNIDKYEALK